MKKKRQLLLDSGTEVKNSEISPEFKPKCLIMKDKKKTAHSGFHGHGPKKPPQGEASTNSEPSVDPSVLERQNPVSKLKQLQFVYHMNRKEH